MKKARYYLYIICSIFGIGHCFAQGIKVGAGCNFKVSGNPTVEIKNGSFINNGNFVCGNGRFYFTGDAATTSMKIAGTNAISFYDLEIRKAFNGIFLQKNINVLNNIKFNKGNIYLNTYTIDLSNTGLLINESNQSRITEFDSIYSENGKVIAVAVLSNPDSANPGNLGLYITSVENLGNTVIMRGHVRVLGSVYDGLYRFYDVAPTNNSRLEATIKFTYFDGDDKDHYESIYQIYDSLNATRPWQLKGYDVRDIAANFVVADSIDTLGRITLAHPDLKLYTGSVATTICAGNPVDVPFSTLLVHDTSNTFYAQLSDDKGQFGTPLIIGSLHGIISDTIHAIIPLSTSGGVNYRIRVVSTSQQANGTNNGQNITINRSLLYYVDRDQDGFGRSDSSAYFCAPTGIYTTPVGGDCNDNDPAITKAVFYYADYDGDGHGYGGTGTETLNESFDNVAAIFSNGWSQLNNSNPAGPGTWDQGAGNLFNAFSGGVNSYIAVGNSSGSGISDLKNWLFSPVLNIANGSIIKFRTRTYSYPTVTPDQLQIRVSTNGNSTQPADFSGLLLVINDSLKTTGYPGTWTEYTVQVAGITSSGTGRIGFYYNVNNGGPQGSNSYYIGIDNVVFTEKSNRVYADCTPPPPNFVLLNDDCNDSIATVYPGAVEYCNGLDDNCDGIAENNLSPTFTGLVAHYPLDINIQDISGNNNHAISATNIIYPSPGVCTSPSFASFGAASDVRLPTSVSDDFSISFWFKTNQTAPSGIHFYEGIALVNASNCLIANDWGIALINNGKVCFGVGNIDFTITSSLNYNDNLWHHVAAERKRSNGDMRLYIDGGLVASGLSTNTNSLTGASVIGLGRSICTLAKYTGSMDEIQLYNRILDSIEVRILSTCNSNVTFYPDADGDGFGVPGSVALTNDGTSFLTSLSNGWTIVNNSSPIGVNSWSQGNSSVYSANSPPADSYFTVDYNSGSSVATISNWLILPVEDIKDGSVLSFKTRARSTAYPDRLQVWLSTKGNSSNVGTTATSTGDFNQLLLDINPNLTSAGYPTSWTPYTINISGYPTAVQGRLAFRYYVPNGGPAGANSDYIGIDDISYSSSNTQFAFCTQPAGYVSNALDCNDGNSQINFAANEIVCNNVDENCNGIADDFNALQLDGANDYIRVPYSAAFNTSTFSVEAWIYPQGNYNGVVVISNRDATGATNLKGYMLYINGAGQWEFWTGNGTTGGPAGGWYVLSSNTNVVPNQWTHVAITYDGSVKRIYLNGVLLPGTQNISYLPNGVWPTYIGAGGNEFVNPIAPAYFFNGKIDEVRFWNVARSQTDIQNSRNNYIPTSQANLVAYYNFDKGTANGNNNGITELTDVTGNAHPGTLTNFGLTGATSNWVSGITRAWYRDADGDGVGSSSNILNSFCTPAGYILTFGDCDDNNAAIKPGAIEICGNFIDDNCNGQIDENNSLSFDGNNDFVSLASTGLTSANDFTMEAWVFPTATKTWYRVFDFGTTNLNYVMLAASNGVSMKPRVGIKSTSLAEQTLDAPAAIPLNAWTHLAFTLSGNTGKLYVNGALVVTNNAVTIHPVNVGATTNNWLGKSQFTQDSLFTGRIDEARVWTVARTQAEIQNSMYQDFFGPQTGLTAYYKFDQGVAGASNTGLNTLTDISGNNRTGTLTNFALNGATSNWATGITRTFYKDQDGDGFGNPLSTLNSFCQPLGYVFDSTDCDDSNALIFGSAPLSINCPANIINNVASGHCTDTITIPPPTYGASCLYGAPGTLAFDGVNDYASVNSANTLSGTFTVEAWAKPAHPTKAMTVIGSRGPGEFSFDFKFQGGNKIHGDIGTGSSWLTTAADANFNYVAGTWYHVAYVITPGNCKIYINGALIVSLSMPNTAPLLYNSNHLFTVGRPGSTFNGERFEGEIDEVRVWNTARTLTEIQNNRGNALSGSEPGLVRYYRLNDGTGTVMKDNSTSAANGALSNFSLSGKTSNWTANSALVQIKNNFNNTANATAVYPAGTTSVVWTATTISGAVNCTQTITVNPPLWYRDADNDSYGNRNDTLRACIKPFGYVPDSTDCNDANSLVNTPKVFYQDNDSDGFGSGIIVFSCTSKPPPGAADNNTDCDDARLLYEDIDKDGYGNPTSVACGVVDNNDCNDNNAGISPGNTESYCNGIDENCNGLIDEGNNFSVNVASTTNACGNLPNGVIHLSITDAVGLVNTTIDTIWAGQVISFSSQSGSGINSWSINDVLGAPNTYPAYGDLPTAWASSSPDNQREFLELGFTSSKIATEILIYETYARGAIDTVFIRDALSGQWMNIYTNMATAQPPVSGILKIPVNYAMYINGVRIALNSPDVADRNEIDAVGIIGTAGIYNGTQLLGSAPSGFSTYTFINGNGCSDTTIAFVQTDTPFISYADADGDGFGDSLNTVNVCSVSSGYVSNADDCNDNDFSVHTKYYYYVDADADGFGAGSKIALCENVAPSGYSVNNTDCNDSDAVINALVLYYADNDHDGFGAIDTANPGLFCSAVSPSGYVTDSTDCNDFAVLYLDFDSDGYGSISTVACGISNNIDCNDNDNTVFYPNTFYRDNDNDGLGNAAIDTLSCDPALTGYVLNDLDCNDNDPLLLQAYTFYRDTDGDLFGDRNHDTVTCSLTPPAGFVVNSNDCNDANPLLTVFIDYYSDVDGDSYGDPLNIYSECSLTPPHVVIYFQDSVSNQIIDSLVFDCVTNHLDCSDTNATVFTQHFFYLDNDSDGFGSQTALILCDTIAPVGYVSNNGDCNDYEIMYVDADNDGYGGVLPVACGVLNSNDCDDNNASIKQYIYYQDADNDGFGSLNSILTCLISPPLGYVPDSSDCNDYAMLFSDRDNDGYGADSIPVACGALNALDCNDFDSLITQYIYYFDGDHDGFGSLNSIATCLVSPPAGFVVNYSDCNDAEPSFADNDGDGFGAGVYIPCGISDSTDCNDADSLITFNIYYLDSDGDSFGSTSTIRSCAVLPPPGYSTNNNDCNDLLLTYNDNDKDQYGAGLPVACGVDNNLDCNDNDSTLTLIRTFYIDTDGDGFGSNDSSFQVCNHLMYPGFVLNNDDCNDQMLLYADLDNDGFGGDTAACGLTTSLDCNDNDSLANPLIAEFNCNFKDDNCNGQIDEGNPLTTNVTGVLNASGANFNGAVNLTIAGGSGVYQILSKQKHADSVIGFSSQTGTTTGTGSATDALGIPNVFPSYGNNLSAWKSVTADNGREFLELGLTPPISINSVSAYQTFNSGAIDTIYVRSALNNSWYMIFNDSVRPLANSVTPYSVILTQKSNLSFPINGIRLAIASNALPGFNQIDAVGANISNGSYSGTQVTGLPSGKFSLTFIDTTSKCPASVTATIGFNGVPTWFRDVDGDGYGNPLVTVSSATQPVGYVMIAGDCDDNNIAVNPSVVEVACNLIDDNCNGVIDENSALHFDGLNDFASTSNPVNLTDSTSFTIEIYAKRQDTPVDTTNNFIISQGNNKPNRGMRIGFTDSTTNRFSFEFSSNNLKAPAIFTDTLWHLWSCISKIKTGGVDRFIYRDGVLVASGSDTAIYKTDTIYQNPGLLFIGLSTLSGLQDYFHGTIDEIRVWKKALTQQNILANLGHGLSGPQPGL